MPEYSLVSETAYMATTGVSFAIAISAAIARTIIRIHHFRQVNADDGFFFLAVASLIVASGFFYYTVPIQSAWPAIGGGDSLPPELFLYMRIATKTALYANLAQLLSWTTIFAIKFSFLFCFRALIRPMPNMIFWWWVIFVILAANACASISEAFIICPHVDSSLFEKCIASPSFEHRERIVIYYTITSDIITDLLLISIPLIILRRASFKPRQKLSIALVLCLSIILIAIAIVRAISAAVHGTRDQPWDLYWYHLEACISVIVACPTAFRTLFIVSKMPKRNPDVDQHPQQPRRKIQWWWSKPRLPSFPIGATVTGIRTEIWEIGPSKKGEVCEGENGSIENGVGQHDPGDIIYEESNLKMGAKAQHGHEEYCV